MFTFILTAHSYVSTQSAPELRQCWEGLLARLRSELTVAVHGTSEGCSRLQSTGQSTSDS